MVDTAEKTPKTPTDFTEGSIIRSILKMGLPSMFGFLAQHIYAMADMFWVARLPQAEAGVAAITFFNNLLWILFSFNSLVGSGSVAVISRRYGEKLYDETEKSIKETIFLKLFFGTLLGVAGWFALPYMLPLLGAKGDALEMGIGYGRILLFGMPIMYAAYSIFTALRGIANPALAMGLMVASNILNAVMDPLFIFGWLGMPECGINGAAYASVLSYSLTFIVGMALFRTNWVNVKLHLVGKASMTLKSMWQIVRIGVPSWAADLSFSGSRMLITPMIAGFGTAVVAAYGVGMQLFAFGIMILVGMGLGLSSLIGHNVGGKKLERAKKTGDQSILLGISVMSVIAVLTFFFAEFYMGLFFDNPQTVAHGVELLRIGAVVMPFFGIFIMVEQIHVGVGLNTPMMVIVTIHSWGFQVLPALVVTQVLGMNQTAVWWVLTFAGIGSSILFWLYYRRGKWLTVRL